MCARIDTKILNTLQALELNRKSPPEFPLLPPSGASPRNTTSLTEGGLLKRSFIEIAAHPPSLYPLSFSQSAIRA